MKIGHNVLTSCLLILASAFAAFGATSVSLPVLKPAVVTSGVATPVRVSVLVTSDGPSIIPTGVSLLAVAADGTVVAALGTLLDDGKNGDQEAGDNIFTTTVTVTPQISGKLYLRVSAAFYGLVRRQMSQVLALEVTPPGLPTGVRQTSGPAVSLTTNNQAICDELFVSFRPELTLVQISTVINAVSGQLVGRSPELGFYQIGLPTCTADRLLAVAQTLQLNPLVRSVSLNNVYPLLQAVAAPSDTYFAMQWGLSQIKAPEAWAVTTRGEKIGVVDTGINYNHEDLAGRFILGRDWVNDNNDPFDFLGHGTGVAGIAGAATNNGKGIAGTAFRTKIVAEKVFDTSRHTSDKVIAQGIVDAIEKGARVINLSLGGTAPPIGPHYLAEAVHYALSRDVVVVAAAGNVGWNIKTYPAAFDGVVAVAASDQQNQRARWSSDVGGPCGYIADPERKESNFGSWIDIYAPGSWLWTLRSDDNSGYRNVCAGGTSFAAPFVSGVAAMMLSTNGTLKPPQIKQFIKMTATPTGNFDVPTEVVGRAEIMLLNAEGAVRKALAVKGRAGAVSITATLDGKAWPGDIAGSVAYTLNCSGESLPGVVVPTILFNLLPNSNCTLTSVSGGPTGGILIGVGPCAGPAVTNCTATMSPGQTLGFTLQFASDPPTAGFLMSAGNQSATDGPTRLNLSVTTGGSSVVNLDARTRSQAYNANTIIGWQWTIDNTLVSATSNLQYTLMPGTHAVSLRVTDSRGMQSQLATGTIVVSQSVTQRPYIVSEIPPLAGVGRMYPVRAINNSGAVVGACGDTASRPCLYDGQIHDLSAAIGDTSGVATDINDKAAVAGVRTTGKVRAFVYDTLSGNVVDLDALIAGSTFSRAFGISNTGRVAGSTVVAGHGSAVQAFLYNNGAMAVLDQRPGEAFDVNDSGVTVGYLFFAGPTPHPFLYDGQMRDLGVLPNFQGGEALAINNNGTVVGYNTSPSQTMAFLYDGFAMRALGVLPGASNSSAAGINNLGQVVGTSDFVAFLWDKGTLINLNTLLPPSSGWQLVTADAINDSGQIVGTGVLNGRNTAYVLTPEQPSMDDDFNGNAINTARWNTAIVPSDIGTITQTNQHIEMIHSNPGVVSYQGLQSRCKLSGDFDVQVDFTLLNWPSQNFHTVRLSADDLPPGPLGVVGIYRNSYNNENYQMRTVNGVVGDLPLSDSSGKMRLVRTGTTISGYYWNGIQFVLLGSSPTTTADTRFVLDFSSPSTTSPANVSVAFDNFKVNRGTVSVCQ